MRILFLLPSLSNTGPINVALELCKQIYDKQDIYVYAFSSGDNRAVFDFYAKEVVVCDESFCKKVYYFFQYIKNNNFDIIHSHCFFPDLLNSLCSKNVKRITTIHNFFDVDYVYTYGILKGKILSLLHRYVVSNIPVVISCSQSVSEYNSINYGINSHFVRNGVKSGKELITSSSHINLVFVGVLNKRKNPEVFINGFRFSYLPNSTLHIIGAGPLYEELKRKYSSDNIIFYGHLDEPREVLKKMDVFVSSSLAEGLPMALLESLSECTTYIISDIAPHREINNLSTSSGFVIKNDIDSFSEAIKNLEYKDINILKSEARKLYVTYLSSHEMGVGYMRIYSNLD
ncbi:glycosyltransferase [Pectobacterium polonicum]|uniref:glycosyltransferase n=1 Tax=Pectobacterium polonicum TaxID=2485124 RepID=UPI002B247AD3|nr:glycosyltransferase [Pectobacterium polonicum]